MSALLLCYIPFQSNANDIQRYVILPVCYIDIAGGNQLDDLASELLSELDEMSVEIITREPSLTPQQLQTASEQLSESLREEVAGKKIHVIQKIASALRIVLYSLLDFELLFAQHIPFVL